MKDISDGPRKLNPINESFMVLMRLRMGLLEFDLAKCFRVSHIEAVQANMPNSFYERYPTTRIIIDCTEIITACPTYLINKSLVYSDYKKLVGINPSGAITYISNVWAGQQI